jgi:hypothetical protein
MTTARQQQIAEAARLREQLADASASRAEKREERKAAAERAVERAPMVPFDEWRHWTKGAMNGEMFAYTVTPVEGFYLSGVMGPPGSLSIVGVVAHRTRKEAKARAWNIYQGYRLACGLKTRWG